MPFVDGQKYILPSR